MMSSLSRGLVATAALVFAVPSPACDSPGGSPPAVFDTSGTRDAGVETDAAPAGDATRPDDDAPPADTTGSGDAAGPPDTAAPGPTPLGVGVVLGEVDSAFLNVAFASARLTRVAPPPDTSGSWYGACRVTTIDPAAPSPARYGLNAGVISVAGTTPPVTFTPVDEGAYGTGYVSSLPEDQVDLLPPGGAIITVTSPGGADVASFSGVVQAPEPVTITLPSTGVGREVDPTRTLTVYWDKGSGESVLVSLSPIDATGAPIAGKAAFCLSPGDPGSLQVPKEALIELAGLGTPLMALGVTRTRTGAATTADHTIPLTVTRSSGGPVRLAPP